VVLEEKPKAGPPAQLPAELREEYGKFRRKSVSDMDQTLPVDFTEQDADTK
jgi:hypothetical protein